MHDGNRLLVPTSVLEPFFSFSTDGNFKWYARRCKLNLGRRSRQTKWTQLPRRSPSEGHTNRALHPERVITTPKRARLGKRRRGEEGHRGKGQRGACHYRRVRRCRAAIWRIRCAVVIPRRITLSFMVYESRQS